MTDGPTDEHVAWIKRRIRDLLFHFYVPSVSDETKRAIMRDWVVILGQFSREEIDQACLTYVGKELRAAPHPGAIKALILKERADRIALERASGARSPQGSEQSYEAPKRRMSEDEVERMFAEIGFRFQPRKFGASNDD